MGNKLKTEIEGLDILLNCNDKALQLNNNKNLLIVIRGERGISKVNLSMQMMLGFSSTSTLNSEPRFYSFDKDCEELRNKYKSISKKEDASVIRDGKSLYGEESNEYLYSKLLTFTKIIQDLDNIQEKSSCIVIEGFAGLSEDDFNSLPIDTMEEMLRKKAQVAILVFDDRLLDRNTSADIIIETRRHTDKSHNYSYFELQISKCFTQKITDGWHRYRCTDERIEVYPSVHKILSSIKPSLYEKIESLEKDPTPHCSTVPYSTHYKDVCLSNIIIPKQKGIITSFIGETNTFKKYLATLSISNLLQESCNNEILVVLFDERREVFIDILKKIYPGYKSHSNLRFLEVPMGCISPDEFINIVQKYKSFVSMCNKLHLFLIDLVALDYSFPTLQGETLFLPALASICKAKNINLNLVCRKTFSLVDTVYSVSDNVVCVERNVSDDVNKLTLYLEKNSFGGEFNSRVFKCEICNIHELHHNIDKNTWVEISSNKEFWRKSINVKNTLKTEISNSVEQ